jgi:HEAT repeat protein
VLLVATGCARDSVVALVAQLDSGSVQERREAARELSDWTGTDERLVPALTGNLNDPDAEVRFFLIRGLGQIGPAAASSVSVLKKSLEDADSRVRVAAALAIQRIDPKQESFVPVLAAAMRDGDGRLLLDVGAMGEEAEWAVPTLIGLLSHDSPQIRALAAQTLGRIGPAAGESVAALDRATKDSNVAVQGAAREAIARIGSGLKPVQREGP